MAAIDTTPPTDQACPQYNKRIPIIQHYVTWCDGCGWNIQPEYGGRPTSTFEQFYVRLGATSSKQLYAEIRSQAALGQKPRQSRMLLPAMVIALVVHAFTLLLGALGLVTLYFSNWNPVLILIAILLLALVWHLFPRPDHMPEHALSASEYPALNKLVNQIAQGLSFKRTPTLAIDHRYNASFGYCGIRHTPVITLGLPLAAVVAPQELVALIAHELAHGVNGDPTRSFLIGSAIQTLAAWNSLFRPDFLQRRRNRPGSSDGEGIAQLFGKWIGNVLMFLFSWIPWTAAYALCHLLWRSSQRAEYRADNLAVQVAGTVGMLGLLTKLHVSEVVSYSLQRQELGRSFFGTQIPPVIDTLRTDIAGIPAREYTRIERVTEHEKSRLDTTHPPTPFRIKALREHPQDMPLITLSPEQQAQIDRELHRLEARLFRDISDEYRSRLYA